MVLDDKLVDRVCTNQCKQQALVEVILSRFELSLDTSHKVEHKLEVVLCADTRIKEFFERRRVQSEMIEVC